MKKNSINSFGNKISKIYYNNIHMKLPKFLKNITFQIFYTLKISIFVRIKHLTIDVYSIIGEEKNNHAELKILFCGEKSSLNYLSSIIYSDKPKVKYIQKTNIFNLQKKLKFFSNKYDMVFVKTDRFFAHNLQKKGFFILPEWAEMQIEVNNSFKEIFNNFSKSAKDDIRKIKNYDYAYSLSKDFTNFEYFYHEIYCPFILNRHGELTISESTNYDEIRALFEKGLLLTVYDEEKIISGMIPVIYDSTAFFTHAGVDIKSNYLTKAAGSALYYFFIDWAEKQGFKLLKFGGVRPFLNGGLFNYKKKWGMSIKISNMMFGIFGLKIINSESKAVTDFLINNPFVIIEKNKIRGLFFTKDKLDSLNLQEIWKKYNIPGLSGITLVDVQKTGGRILLEEQNFA